MVLAALAALRSVRCSAPEGYDVVAINDLTSPKMLAHLLKYDTAQGGYCGKIGKAHTVEATTSDSITVDGKMLKIYAKSAKDLPWGELALTLFSSAQVLHL